MRRRSAGKAGSILALFIPLLGVMSNSVVIAAEARRPAQSLPPFSTGNGVTDGVARPDKGAVPEMKRLSHLPGKLVVKLKTPVMPDYLSARSGDGALEISARTLSHKSHDRFKEIYIVSGGEQQDLAGLAAELRGDDAVEYVEPIGIAYTQLVPSDPLYARQWSHQKTGAETGWSVTTGEPSVVIAVIDTGVAYDHPDLAGNIWRDALGHPGKDLVNIDINDYLNAGYWLAPGEDYQGGDFDPADFYGHGTHVAGIAAASGNNGIGISGVCPRCRIMPIRAGFTLRRGAETFGMLQSDHIAEAIVYAADNGARIINMSFGGTASRLISEAIDYAHSKGVVLIAAAGNGNVSSTDLAYPAAYQSVLAVAATGSTDQKTFYSNYGNWIAVAAPGGDADLPILSTLPAIGSSAAPSGYGNMYGTSMAAPYVAGAAGLLLSKNGNLNNGQLRQAVRQGVDIFNVDIADSQQYLGTGRLSLAKGLSIDSVSTATARISAPRDDFFSGAVVSVTGSASAPYRIFYGQGVYPAAWSEFGSGPAASDTVLATLESSALPSPFDTYTLKLVAQDQAGKVEEFVQGRIGRQFLPGWPQPYSFDGKPAPVWNSPTLADLDHDGFDEILIAGRDRYSRGIINVFAKDGSVAEGLWPQAAPIAGTAFDFGAAAGDINGDGELEVIAPYYGTAHGLICWDRFGNQLWSKVLEPDHPALNLTLADVTGDGRPEIITQASNSRLYVLDSGGAVLWSYLPGEYDSIYYAKRIAAADFDADGKSELVKNVITNIRFEPGDIYRIMGGSLLVLNSDGTLRWKYDWPEPGEPLGNSPYQIYPTGSPLVGDINGDGKQEIVVRVSAWKGDITGYSEVWARFYAFNQEGSLMPGWPVRVSGFPAFSELAQGDSDGDGHLEICGGAGGRFHVLGDTGIFRFPPLEFDAVSNPAIADVTGDGRPDILVNDGSVFRVIGHDGSVSSLGITVRDLGYSNVHNTPIATDLDKNGSQDLIFLEWQNRPVVWAWDLQVPHSGKLDQSITFEGTVRTFGDAPIDLATLASGGASGEPVTFSLTSGPGVLSAANNATLTLTGAGTIVIVASQAGNAMYNPAPDVQQTITVNKAAASVSLGNLSRTYDGAAQQVNATTDPPGRSVSITYDGSAGAPVNVGSYTVVASVTDPNYIGSASGTLTIAKAVATVTLEELSATYDGSPKPAAATTTPPGKAVALSYDGSASAPINAGSYAVVATVVDANYSGSASGTMVICKATPTLSWGTPAIFYGSALSARELNAVANVPGNFSYTPSFGYLAPVGLQTLSVLFTPTDSINLTSATATTTLSVINETFSIVFLSGENGTLNGATSQTVIRGRSSTPVIARPAEGYHFAEWTGTGGFASSRANPLTVSNVTASQTITAHFALIDGVVVPEEGKTRPDLNDALRVMRIALGQIPATESDLVHGDIAPLGDNGKPKGNGAIDLYDVIGILRMTVGLL